MHIEFIKVTGKNFLSIGNNSLTLELNNYSKLLIIGKNGSGKSIWLDLIIFVLFGKAYRNINKSALINSINGKQCETEIEFTINENHYKIIRNIKPEKFEIYIDDVLLVQDAATKDYQEYLETNIIKMDYKTACQMMVIGAMNYIPFLQLKALERRSFIEALLDLQLFTDMNKNLKLIVADEKSKYTTIQNFYNIYNSKISTYENIIKDLESNKDKKKDQINLQLKDKMIEYKSYIAESEDYKSKAEAITYIDTSKEIQNTILDSSGQISFAISSSEKLKNKIKYFDTTSECSVCQQSIDPTHKKTHIDSMELEIKDNQSIIDEHTITKQNAVDESTKLNLLKSNKQLQESNMNKSLSNAEYVKKDIVRLGKELKELDATNDSTLSNTKNKLNDSIKLKDENELKLNESKVILETYAIMLNDLKDTGAKSQIIENYIPIINKAVNNYLDKFNLYLKFELDSQFNETLKSRNRDNFTFESFSNGEKFRVNMSMLFSWLDITKIRAGVSSNLLFLDEILEICDEAGSDELLAIINTKQKTNLFVISHKENLDVKFDRVITMSKVKEFSQID